MTIEYALNGADRSQGNAAGVYIDGVIYPLQGEPPIAHSGNWFGHVAPSGVCTALRSTHRRQNLNPG